MHICDMPVALTKHKYSVSWESKQPGHTLVKLSLLFCFSYFCYCWFFYPQVSAFSYNLRSSGGNDYTSYTLFGAYILIQRICKKLNIMKRMLSSKWNKREKRNIVNSRFVTASVAFYCHRESSQFANTSSILSILRLHFMCNLIWDCVISLKSQ